MSSARVDGTKTTAQAASNELGRGDMPQRKRVGIIALGGQTALGQSMHSSVAAVRAGIGRSRREHSDVVVGDLFQCRAAYLDPDAPAARRCTMLALGAASQALAPLALSRPRELPVLVGLPASRPSLPADLASQLSQALREGLQPLLPAHMSLGVIETFRHGHAAGLTALQRALALIDQGSTPFCLVGGVDSYVDRETLAWLSSQNMLRSRRNRWGFVAGEGAGFCLLGSIEECNNRHIPLLAEVVAVALARETKLAGSDVCSGEGLATAWRGVLTGHAQHAKQLASLHCDLNGRRARVDELGFALSRCAPLFTRPPSIVAPAAFWGDVGAATAPLLLGLLSAPRGKRLSPRSYHLVSTRSWSGQSGAALIASGIDPADRVADRLAERVSVRS